MVRGIQPPEIMCCETCFIKAANGFIKPFSNILKREHLPVLLPNFVCVYSIWSQGILWMCGFGTGVPVWLGSTCKFITNECQKHCMYVVNNLELNICKTFATQDFVFSFFFALEFMHAIYWTMLVFFLDFISRRLLWTCIFW